MRGQRCELIAGVPKIMSPSGGEHGALAADIIAILANHVRPTKLGRCFGAETGFVIARGPDTVRAPDAAFVKQNRIEELGISKKYFPEPPALAVEIVSPSDPAPEVHEKAQMWIEAGSEMVWLIWPGDRSVTVYRSLADIQVHKSGDTLVGGEVLPGFRLPVAELFAGLS